MPRYRHKPDEILAGRWAGDNYEELLLLLREGREGGLERRPGIERLIVHTAHGPVNADVGDYIVIDGQGYPYPVTAALFETIYEMIE